MFYNCVIIVAVFGCIVNCASAGVYAAPSQYTVGLHPSALTLGNLRGNGLYRDLAVANSTDNTVSVRLCLDDGTFGRCDTYAVGLNPAAIHYGDFNRDGMGDLVVVNAGTNTVSVLINAGVGANFRSAVDYVVGETPNPCPSDVCVTDVNKDGRVDLAVANYKENSVSVLTNSGGGVLSGLINYPVGEGPVSVTVCDLNRDGELDIVTANKDDGTLSILYGAGNREFVLQPAIELVPDGDPQPVSVRARDVDGDGIIDLMVANYNSNSVSVLLGTNIDSQWLVRSQSNYPVGIRPVALLSRDLNHDEIYDIAVANSGSSNVTILIGVGLGVFENQGQVQVGNRPSAISGSNFNNDDVTDLAVANYDDNSVTVLLYDGPVAYNVAQSCNEDVATPVAMRGALLGGGAYLFLTNTAPVHGVLSGGGVNWVYTPDANYFGKDSFVYRAVDIANYRTSSAAIVSLSVLPVNDAPSFDLALPQVTVMEDAATTNLSSFVTNMLMGPVGANETNQTASFLITPLDTAFFSGKPSISSAGVLTFKPAINRVGSVDVRVQMRDNGGNLRGGTNGSAIKTFMVSVTPNPLKPLRGVYSGLFYEASGVRAIASGSFTFTMAANGSFSGRLVSQYGRDAFTGKFDLSGRATVIVNRANNSSVELDLQLDMSRASDRVVGIVTEGHWIADLLGNRLIFDSRSNPPPQTGAYTLVLPGFSNSIAAPAGFGGGFISVSASGNVVNVGRLGDGKAYSQSGYLSRSGEFPLYQSLYSGQGLLLGWLRFTNRQASSLEGSVHWVNAVYGEKFYPDGYNFVSQAIGSTYVAPGLGQRVLNLSNNCSLIISGGNLINSITNAVVYTETNSVVSFSGSVILKLANSANGSMSGSFVHPDLNLKRNAYGVVLQQQNSAFGFFLGTNQSGGFYLRSD